MVIGEPAAGVPEKRTVRMPMPSSSRTSLATSGTPGGCCAGRAASRVTAIAVLAISIGANTAVFSVINSLLLRPLPYPDAERIVQVVITHDPSKVNYTLDTSIPKFIAWKQSVRVFSHLAAYQAADPGVNLVDADCRSIVVGVLIGSAVMMYAGTQAFNAGVTATRSEAGAAPS